MDGTDMAQLVLAALEEDDETSRAWLSTFLKITCVAQKNYLPAREKFSEFHPPSLQGRPGKVSKTRVFRPGFRFFAQDCVFFTQDRPFCMARELILATIDD